MKHSPPPPRFMGFQPFGTTKYQHSFWSVSIPQRVRGCPLAATPSLAERTTMEPSGWAESTGRVPSFCHSAVIACKNTNSRWPKICTLEIRYVTQHSDLFWFILGSLKIKWERKQHNKLDSSWKDENPLGLPLVFRTESRTGFLVSGDHLWVSATQLSRGPQASREEKLDLQGSQDRWEQTGQPWKNRPLFPQHSIGIESTCDNDHFSALRFADFSSGGASSWWSLWAMN